MDIAKATINGSQTFGSSRKEMASVGSLRNSYTTIGISRPSQRDMPMDVARYATVGEVDAE
jgi:hypothetical protein